MLHRTVLAVTLTVLGLGLRVELASAFEYRDIWRALLPSDIAEYRRRFEVLDKDGSGGIEKEELIEPWDIDAEDVGEEGGRWSELLAYFEQCDSGEGLEDAFYGEDEGESDGEDEVEGGSEKKQRAGAEAGDGAISFPEYLVCAGQWTDHGEMFDFSEWDYLSTIGVLTEEGAANAEDEEEDEDENKIWDAELGRFREMTEEEKRNKMRAEAGKDEL